MLFMSIFAQKHMPQALAQETPQMRIFDAQGEMDSPKALAIREIFDECGALHISNTNIRDKNDLLPLLPALGFAEHEQYSAGGRTSFSWQEKWVAPGLRRMDYYPPHLYLLPNNEIQYQRIFPTRILFFCNTAPAMGGRTFLHSARDVEQRLASHDAGKNLLRKLSQHGMTIETGFLDAAHPEKKNNYFQSWQERFGTQDKKAALEAAQSLKDEYDECWWKEDGGHSILMTRITLPSFFTDKRDSQNYLRFPRIAADGPSIRNGFRRFPFGNGEEPTEQEKTLLRKVYTETQQGRAWQTGDIILMDNIRYAHSREAFEGPREILIGMAGTEKISKKGAA